MNMKAKTSNKLAALSTPDLDWMKEAEFEKSNKGWLDKSRKIAVKVLRVLRERKMSQTDLATSMGISRQMVSKILKGKENLTLSTIYNLEKSLETDLQNEDSDKVSPLCKVLNIFTASKTEPYEVIEESNHDKGRIYPIKTHGG